MEDFRRPTTRSSAYVDRLVSLQTVWWKRLLPVQAPYRWNLRRLNPGRVLDVGCGAGRSLRLVDGNGVGVDHNPGMVAHCCSVGLTAFEPQEFLASEHARPATFDSLLLAHVLEHLSEDETASVISQYLPFVRHDGKVIVMTPQERGFASDPTHRRWMDFDLLTRSLARHHLVVKRKISFPFPRCFGRLFIYNEFVVVATLP